MPTIADVALPEPLREGIDRAVRILREAGCTEVYLFGSVAKGKAQPGSDVDIAVRSCPDEQFFTLLSRLCDAVGRDVDLVDLDAPTPLARFLQQKEGRMVRLG